LRLLEFARRDGPADIWFRTSVILSGPGFGLRDLGPTLGSFSGVVAQSGLMSTLRECRAFRASCRLLDFSEYSKFERMSKNAFCKNKMGFTY
jgi:hypothetical protein